MLRLRPSSPPHSGWAEGGWRGPPLVGHWQGKASAKSGGPGPNSCDPHQPAFSRPRRRGRTGDQSSRAARKDPWRQIMFKVVGWIETSMNSTKMYQHLEYSSGRKSGPTKHSANQVISHICVPFFFPQKGQANLRFSYFGCNDEH